MPLEEAKKIYENVKRKSAIEDTGSWSDLELYNMLLHGVGNSVSGSIGKFTSKSKQ